MPNAYKVRVVVDRSFGQRLSKLSSDVPVWIVDSPTNKPFIQKLWEERPTGSHLTGVTAFKDNPMLDPESLLLGEVDSIDLHHGSYSADPPYTVMEVLGVSLSDNIRNALGVYGFETFEKNSNGFVASRPRPTQP